MPHAVRARFVFPVDRPPIENGVVTIDGAQIVDVGTSTVSDNVTDLGSVALFPGLVNAHTHLEFSYLRQPLGQPGMRLIDWIRLVIAERARSNVSRIEVMVNANRESHAAGVTSIADITTADLPIGADVNFCEVIGFSRARAESAMNALALKVGTTAFMHIPDARRRVESRNRGISPHAPYTVSPQLLRDLVERAHLQNLPMAMHIAESREELQLLRDGTGPFQLLLEERSMWDPEAIPRGSTPFDYLCMLANAPRSLVIHGNYLEDDELQFLATHKDRMSLIYCPRTHAYFGHSPYPLTKALELGVRIALGTDSRASNPDLNLLSEMRFVAQSHPQIDPYEIIRMGTLAGAEALGREDDVGSITSQKTANLVAVPLSDPFSSTARDALTEALHSDKPASAVWLRGERLKLESSGFLPFDGEG